MKKQVGFTLVELLIAMALGLIIAASATMLFLTGLKSQALQTGQSGLQDDANFGLNFILKDVRLSNLNTVQSGINDTTAYGGMVFSSSTTGGFNNSNLPIDVAETLLSQSNLNLSNAQSVRSDQLTIQFLPQYIWDDKKTATTADDRWYGGFDCEGNALEFTRDQGRQMVVQRYFLAVDENAGDTEPNQPLALYCDAGYYALEGDPTSITNFGEDPQIVLKRVDHFRVLYSIQNGSNHRYVDANTYLQLDSPRPRILSVQLGILMRSLQSVGRDNTFSDEQVFQVLDQALQITEPDENAPKYVRQVVTQTIALRNTFGERGQ